MTEEERAALQKKLIKQAQSKGKSSADTSQYTLGNVGETIGGMGKEAFDMFVAQPGEAIGDTAGVVYGAATSDLGLEDMWDLLDEEEKATIMGEGIGLIGGAAVKPAYKAIKSYVPALGKLATGELTKGLGYVKPPKVVKEVYDEMPKSIPDAQVIDDAVAKDVGSEIVMHSEEIPYMEDMGYRKSYNDVLSYLKSAPNWESRPEVKTALEDYLQKMLRTFDSRNSTFYPSKTKMPHSSLSQLLNIERFADTSKMTNKQLAEHVRRITEYMNVYAHELIDLNKK